MKPLLPILLLTFTSLHLSAQTKEEYYSKALELWKEDNYKVALQYINMAISMDSTNLDYLMLKGDVLTGLRQYENAYRIFSYVTYRQPDNVWAWNSRGLLLSSVSQFEDAIRDFDEGLKLKASDSVRVSLYINRGAAKISIRQFQEAYKDFKEAYKLDSSNIGVLNNLATVCDEVGKGDSTLIYLHRILTIDSTFVGAYVNIGFKYQEMGEYKTAIQYFDKILSFEPDQPLALNNRAYNKYKMGDMKGAMADVQQSIKIFPANSYAYRNRALIYLALKETENACADINKALELGFTKMYGDGVEKLKQEHCIKTKL